MSFVRTTGDGLPSPSMRKGTVGLYHGGTGRPLLVVGIYPDSSEAFVQTRSPGPMQKPATTWGNHVPLGKWDELMQLGMEHGLVRRREVKVTKHGNLSKEA